jgi:hypothetical protein
MWDEGDHFVGGLLFSRGQIDSWIWTNSFYPPIFDMVTAAFFILGGGPSVFAGKFVALTFCVLSMIVIYAIAERMYGAKTALLSAVFFGIMPGIIWASRMAMIETMLIFILSTVMLFFFRWLKTGSERDRIFFTVAIGIGAAIKYQMLVIAPLIVIAGMFFWKRDYLKREIASYFRHPRVILTIIAVTVVVVAASAVLLSGLLDIWFYAIQFGTAEKAAYSIRYPMPIYYLIEMTWISSDIFPTWIINDIHPISPLLYITGLIGMALFAFRRKSQDKFLLLWFTVVYLVFTAIPNREWRYVTTLFPVLSISAASIIIFAFSRFQKIWQNSNVSVNKKRLARIAALVLIMFTVIGISYSCYNSYNWIEQDRVQAPVGEAVGYVAQSLNENGSLMVVCPLNYFNKQIARFYLNLDTSRQNNISQYPKFAVDAYVPELNITELIEVCEQNHTQYAMLYEYEATEKYFGSALTAMQVHDILIETGRFSFQASIGVEPRRIFIFEFKQQTDSLDLLQP